MVLRYVAEVPLNAVTKRVIEKLEASELHELAGSDTGDRFEELGIHVERMRDIQEELKRLKLMMAPVGQLVVNEESGVVHASASRLGPTSCWVTKCGWAYAKSRHAVLRLDDPGEAMCATCFRDAQADS